MEFDLRFFSKFFKMNSRKILIFEWQGKMRVIFCYLFQSKYLVWAFVLLCLLCFTFNTFSSFGVFQLKLMIQVKIIFHFYRKIGLCENVLSLVQHILSRMRKKKRLKRNLLNEVNSLPAQSFRRRIFSKAIRFLHAAKLFTSAKGSQF